VLRRGEAAAVATRTRGALAAVEMGLPIWRRASGGEHAAQGDALAEESTLVRRGGGAPAKGGRFGAPRRRRAATRRGDVGDRDEDLLARGGDRDEGAAGW